jgi:NAD(P)-dependent dehydrogenase (short-subunit alcohol dehydrogenase family)
MLCRVFQVAQSASAAVGRRSFSRFAKEAGRMNDKVAVITGGGSGIGRETALLFAREGARGIVIADWNDEAGNGTVADIGERAIYVKTDVSNAEHVKALFEKAEAKFGSVEVIFNNAGIMHVMFLFYFILLMFFVKADDNDAVTTEDKVWDLTFNVNVKGVWYGCKYGIPALQRAGGGSIINTASFVALLGAATPQLAYTSSKGAVLAMTRELAVIHAKQNIRVNALCPGPVRTDLLMDFLNTQEKKQRRLVHVPMGRFGEAREMAYGALFLASDESSYVTGTEFLVDGGLTAAYVTPE